MFVHCLPCSIALGWLSFAASGSAPSGQLVSGTPIDANTIATSPTQPQTTPAGIAPLHFQERTSQAGLVSGNQMYPSQVYRSMIGGGVAADFNNDGYHDILALGSVNPNKLFINNQDGTFDDHASDWGIEGPFHSYGASTADYNNDGYMDVFITSYGPSQFPPRPGMLKLFRNNGPDEHGQFSFTDVAHEVGLNRLVQSSNIYDGTGSGWGDYDLDGDLDLFVCGYNSGHQGNRLFRNDGPSNEGSWTFTDVTESAGLLQMAIPGFLPAFADMNGDLYPELIIVSDIGTSRYYTNNKDGTFTNDTQTVRGIGTANAMGIDIADLNDDHLPDFFISNIRYSNPPSGGNILLMQNPDGSYDNHATSTGTRDGYWGWGVLINDFDHDGDHDIMETNGFPHSGFGNDPMTLYLNAGTAEHFDESAQACGIDHVSQGRGLVRLDADNDGDLDIMVFNNQEANTYFENRLISSDFTPEDCHWARFVLDTSKRRTLAPSGIGAKITVITPTKTKTLQIHSNTTHCGSSPAEAHLGLADETIIETLQVQWPDGSFTTWTDLDADQILNLQAPSSPVDYDGSDSVSADDVFAFIDLMSTQDLRADHNGDLRVNFFDISAFIQDYRSHHTP